MGDEVKLEVTERNKQLAHDGNLLFGHNLTPNATVFVHFSFLEMRKRLPEPSSRFQMEFIAHNRIFGHVFTSEVNCHTNCEQKFDDGQSTLFGSERKVQEAFSSFPNEDHRPRPNCC